MVHFLQLMLQGGFQDIVHLRIPSIYTLHSVGFLVEAYIPMTLSMYNTRKPNSFDYTPFRYPTCVPCNAPLVLSGNLLSSHLLDSVFCDITKSDHTGSFVSERPDKGAKGNDSPDGLPDTQSNTGSNTSVKTLHTVLAVDVLGCRGHSHLLRPVGVLRLTLHLNANDLDRLVPSGETTTDSRCQDLLWHRKLLAFRLASQRSNTVLSHTRQSES